MARSKPSKRKPESRPEPACSTPPQSERKSPNQWFIFLAVFALVLTAFLSCLRNEFLYSYGDDPIYVTENPHVKSGLTLENVLWAFPSTERSNWHPVTWISHMLDCEIYGLKPWGHHLTSVLLHAANAALLFLLLRRMTAATWRSVIVALVFALHPLRVESVAWVAERKDVLSTFFWMLTLLMYARYVQLQNPSLPSKPRWLASYILALVFFACGLMSKAMVVTLPCVMLLLDYWPLKRVRGAMCQVSGKGQRTWVFGFLVLEKIPFVLLVVIASVYTYIAQDKWGFVQSLGQYSLGTRLANAVVSYGRYLLNMAWPVNLSSFYPHPGHWPTVTVLLAAFVLTLISLVAAKTFRSRPYFGVGWCWYLGSLVPVIGIVQLAGQAIADRYTYIPMIGVLLCCVWGLHEFTKGWQHQQTVAIAASALILIPCVALTQLRIADFKDGSTRWRHDLGVTGKHGLAQFALGLSLDKEGRTDEGIRELQDIVKAKPEWAEAHCNLGIMLCKQERYDEALGYYAEAIRLRPDFTQAHHYLGFTLLKKGLVDDAIEQLQRTTAMAPRFAPAHAALAMAYETKGRIDEAISEYELAAKAQPDYAQAYNSLGLLLLKKQRAQEAIFNFEQALKYKPDYADARQNLERARAAQR